MVRRASAISLYDRVLFATVIVIVEILFVVVVITLRTCAFWTVILAEILIVIIRNEMLVFFLFGLFFSLQFICKQFNWSD